MSEQQLVTEAASRKSTEATQISQTDTSKKNPCRVSGVPDVSTSHSPSLSQHSLVHNQPRPTAVSSRAATRIDWYKLGEEQPDESRSTLSKTEWFGYGGGPRVTMEFLDQTFQVNPSFGCIFVGTSCVSQVKEIPQPFKVCQILSLSYLLSIYHH